MHKTILKGLSFVAVSAMLFGLLQTCNNVTPTSEREQIPAVMTTSNVVDTITLKDSSFFKEIVSNGKLRAVQKTELRFRVSGVLQEISVNNGAFVKRNQSLASLDDFEYQQRVNLAETAKQNAHIEMQDMILSYAGLKSKDSISAEVKKTLASKAGYSSAIHELSSALYSLNGTVLRAPFSGTIANIKRRRYEKISSDEVFCLLIDDSQFEVEFSLIESEIHDVKVGQPAIIVPLAGESECIGYVSEINPVVNDNGLIFAKARLKNNGSLWEGMNVKVVIKLNVGSQFIVPKSAVVLRQNKEVLFKYVNGEAAWVYVKTLHENSTSFAVEPDSQKGGSLKEGDVVIIEGNLNLAHQSPVTIAKK